MVGKDSSLEREVVGPWKTQRSQSNRQPQCQMKHSGKHSREAEPKFSFGANHNVLSLKYSPPVDPRKKMRGWCGKSE